MSPLELLESLDTEQPWRFTMTRTRTHARIWRVFLGDERRPRFTLREPA